TPTRLSNSSDSPVPLCPQGSPSRFPPAASVTTRGARVCDVRVPVLCRSSPRNVPAREHRQASAMAPGGLQAPRNSLAIEDTEHAPEAVRRGLAVREPPRHRDAAAVGVDELHPRAVIEAVLRVGAPDA